jgi:MSHA pilin protein MshD
MIMCNASIQSPLPGACGSVYGISRRRGLTLIEVMFATIIMATMLVASFGAVSSAAKTRIAQQESAFGLALARQLLTEIVQTRYQDLTDPIFGVETGETRATYDDVDDYDGLAENSGKYADGATIPGATGWKRKVTVDWVDSANPNVKVLTETGLKRIRVKVTTPSGKDISLYLLRSKYDRYEQVPASQSTYTSWAGVSIQVGTSTLGRNVQGVNLVNLSP